MSAITKKFYNLFWANEACRQIFSQHKEQLLEKEEIEIGQEKRVFYLQRIVLSNETKRKVSTKLIESRIENQKVDLNDDFQNKVTKHFDEAKFQALINTHFGKAIEKIEKRVSSGAISQIGFGVEILNSFSSEERLIMFLKKYHLINENINSFSQLEEIFSKTVSSFLTKERILEFIESLDKISDYYTTEVYQNLIESNKFYINLLYDTESFKNREELFDLLYEAKILEGGFYKTYYECHSCDESVFKSIATVKAKPSKVVLKCPVCSKQMFYLSPFRINNDIYNHIIDKDGIIKFAVIYLLLEKGFTLKENFNIPPDIELDLVAFNKNNFSVILELKMFKTDTPIHTQKSNLNSAIVKASKAKEKLFNSDNSFQNTFSIVITNYNDKELIKEIRELNKEKMKQFKIKLLSLDELVEYLNSNE